MTKVTVNVTLVAKFESKDPNKAEYFAQDFVQRLRFTVPYDSIEVAFKTTGDETNETE